MKFKRSRPSLGGRRAVFALRGTLVLLAVAAAPALLAHAAGAEDWLTVADHAVEEDTRGWSFPVEIAFVPNPGPGPKDPLYYVSELRGTIKVVTNDRTISVYAEDVAGYQPPTELPSKFAEVGLAGLCLDAARGLLFATTVYYRESRIYNQIVRFDHAGGKFGLVPSARREFRDLFAETPSAVSHQIGKCIIGTDGMLYVGVGDGLSPPYAQRLDNPNGKILRMTTEFRAPVDNPFYDPAAPAAPRSYIYAHGLRNPFAVTRDDKGNLYAAENGVNVDRLLEIHPGRNYLWDGTNDSTSAQGIWYWRLAVGPAGMTYLPEGNPMQEWAGRLVVAQGGLLSQPGPSRAGRTTITSYPVRPGQGLQALPETLAWYSGKHRQLPVPVAIGPDGLYFSGFVPDNKGQTTILKIVRKPGARPKNQAVSGEQLFRERGCEGCHQLQGVGGGVGPALDRLVDRLRERLTAREYEVQIETLRGSEDPVHVQFRADREALLAKEGDDRVRNWIALRLKEPRFDMAESAMPNPNLQPNQIESLADYLMTLQAEPKETSLKIRAKEWWDTSRNARPTAAFVLGILLTFAAIWFVGWIRRTLWFGR